MAQGAAAEACERVRGINDSPSPRVLLPYDDSFAASHCRAESTADQLGCGAPTIDVLLARSIARKVSGWRVKERDGLFASSIAGEVSAWQVKERDTRLARSIARKVSGWRVKERGGRPDDEPAVAGEQASIAAADGSQSIALAVVVIDELRASSPPHFTFAKIACGLSSMDERGPPTDDEPSTDDGHQ